MNILMILIPAAILLAFVFVVFFIWAANQGQFDDLESPAHRILMGDQKDQHREKNPSQTDGVKIVSQGAKPKHEHPNQIPSRNV